MKSIVGVGWLGLLALSLACGGTSANQPKPVAEGGEGGSASSGAGKGGAASSTGGSAVVGAGGEGGASPEGPPSQGAMIMSIAPQSTPPVGRACPTMTFTADIPQTALPDQLSDTNYQDHVIDGEAGASVTCRVAGSDTFEVEGRIQLAGRALVIEDGIVSGTTGTATITVMDSSRLSPASLSSSMPCTLDVGTSNLQIQSGAIWARFDCASVVSPPTSECQAEGYFVLENCEQE